MYTRSMRWLSVLLVLGVTGAALGELVGHWKLDEGSGTTVSDSSGQGNDGTIVNSPTWIDGVLGAALEFHGDPTVYGGGDYVDCGNGSSLDSRSKLSIALWIRPGADDPEGKGTAGGETAPMAKAMNPDWNWQVRYGWGGAPKPFMAFTFNTSPRAWAFVGRNLIKDEWCHIACSFDGTTLKSYLNGEPVESTSMGPIAGGNMPVLIGSDGWGCDWIGAIDDVRSRTPPTVPPAWYHRCSAGWPDTRRSSMTSTWAPARIWGRPTASRRIPPWRWSTIRRACSRG
jgi:hypothetical protein